MLEGKLSPAVIHKDKNKYTSKLTCTWLHLFSWWCEGLWYPPHTHKVSDKPNKPKFLRALSPAPGAMGCRHGTVRSCCAAAYMKHGPYLVNSAYPKTESAQAEHHPAMALPFLKRPYSFWLQNRGCVTLMWVTLLSNVEILEKPSDSLKIGSFKGISDGVLKYQSISSIYYLLESKAVNSPSHRRIVCNLQQSCQIFQ